jgi:Trk K+ transport system NAD-binding subunit
MNKNIVCGLGEIGSPIYKLLSKNHVTVGYDLD